MALTEKERAEAFELGRLAGVAEEHMRTFQTILTEHQHRDEVTFAELREGQIAILNRLDELNNWRWIVVGFAAAVAFVMSLLMTSLKQLWK